MRFVRVTLDLMNAVLSPSIYSWSKEPSEHVPEDEELEQDSVEYDQE